MKKAFLFLTALLFALGSSPTPTHAQSRVPGTPTGVTAARTPAGSTTVLVSWNAVSGATSYRVYWSSTNNGDGGSRHITRQSRPFYLFSMAFHRKIMKMTSSPT